MALTITFKRKFYASETAMENAGETVGGQAGSVVGAGTGAVAGGLVGGTIAAGIGAVKGWKDVDKARAGLESAQNTAAKAKDSFLKANQAKNAAKAGGLNTVDDLTKAAKKANEARVAANKTANNMAKVAQRSNIGNAARKAGKWGLIAGLGTAVAGGVLGSSMGKSTGQSVGAAAGNVVGGTVDSVNNRIAGNNQQRQYAVSQGAKSVWGAVKGFVPKSKRMKAARGVVKADKKVQGAVFEAATNPGGLAKTAVETVGKNPLSVAPGYTGSTALLTAAKKGKLTTPDTVLKKTVIGKPIYAATEYTGRKLGQLAEPLVNSAYQMAKVM